VELGHAISAALETIRDREAVRRAINSLDKSVSDAWQLTTVGVHHE